MVLRHVWLLPVASVFCALCSFFISYGIGVSRSDISSFWPYISDGGAYPPESCIFGQFLNMAAFLMMLTMYLRHRQTVAYYGHRLQMAESNWRFISASLLCIGLLSAFSSTLVANFQETNSAPVHLIGATATFLLGGIYCWGQVLFEWATTPRMAATWVIVTRTLLAASSTVFLILHELCQNVKPFVKRVNGHLPYNDQDGSVVKKYHSDSPFYGNYLVTTFAEWLMVLSFFGYILTFAVEMRHAYMHAPRVELSGPYRRDTSTSGYDDIPGTSFTVNTDIPAPIPRAHYEQTLH